MTTYRIEVSLSAEKELKSLPDTAKVRIVAMIDLLSENPRRISVIKIQGGENEYRARVGNYRIIFKIDDAQKSVLITVIAHRRETYR
jgi:mRNA interferase RelE/StbE